MTTLSEPEPQTVANGSGLARPQNVMVKSSIVQMVTPKARVMVPPIVKGPGLGPSNLSVRFQKVAGSPSPKSVILPDHSALGASPPVPGS